ncbi:MAG: F0F1 ATP synthase subunit gamma, partial [Candidatus Eremiobacteraeota bacterium]|nr:F0F1 ATP synthase subunit gamma [Candidatus Eremiobacteraeota bacterium]
KPGKEDAPPGIVLISADKGLAGAFNSNVIGAAQRFAHERGGAAYYTVGLKARNAIRRLGLADRPAWALGATSKIETARAAACAATADFNRGAISEIVLVSQKLVSMMSQRPETRKLVPILASSFGTAPAGPAQDDKSSKGAIEFAPSPEFVLSRLLPKYLEFTIYSAMLETDAAFFAAQLVAMTNATDNASKLIDELTIAMNNARQAAITKELLEIVAGAEALGVE